MAGLDEDEWESMPTGDPHLDDREEASEPASAGDAPAGLAGGAVGRRLYTLPVEDFPEITVPGRTGCAHIGCGGYNYPHWRKNVFYPSTVKQDDELKFYGGRLSCVEINNTFHGIPREQTFKKWATETPKNFVFTIKVPQEITHKQRLKDIDGVWQFFSERVISTLGAKTGPFLFQLPPSLKRDDERLKTLVRLIPAGHRVALEFRSHDWFCAPVATILRQHDIALVENITPDNSLPSYEWVTATWTYTRLHGAKEEIHTVDFKDDVLDPLAARIAARRAKGLDQYVFFLNDVDGVAPKNAASLIAKVLALVGDAALTSLAPGWRPEREIKKGGPGSIASMFKKAADKAAPSPNLKSEATKASEQAPAKLPKTAAADADDDVVVVEHASTPATPTKAATSASSAPSVSPQKGSIAAFFKK